MKNARHLASREAVARSLRALEKLFGKKPPDRNGNATLQGGAGETLLTGKLKRGIVR